MSASNTESMHDPSPSNKHQPTSVAGADERGPETGYAQDLAVMTNNYLSLVKQYKVLVDWKNEVEARLATFESEVQKANTNFPAPVQTAMEEMRDTMKQVNSRTQTLLQTEINKMRADVQQVKSDARTFMDTAKDELRDTLNELKQGWLDELKRDSQMAIEKPKSDAAEMKWSLSTLICDVEQLQKDAHSHKNLAKSAREDFEMCLNHVKSAVGAAYREIDELRDDLHERAEASEVTNANIPISRKAFMSMENEVLLSRMTQEQSLSRVEKLESMSAGTSARLEHVAFRLEQLEALSNGTSNKLDEGIYNVEQLESMSTSTSVQLVSLDDMNKIHERVDILVKELQKITRQVTKQYHQLDAITLRVDGVEERVRDHGDDLSHVQTRLEDVDESFRTQRDDNVGFRSGIAKLDDGLHTQHESYERLVARLANFREASRKDYDELESHFTEFNEGFRIDPENQDDRENTDTLATPSNISNSRKRQAGITEAGVVKKRKHSRLLSGWVDEDQSSDQHTILTTDDQGSLIDIHTAGLPSVLLANISSVIEESNKFPLSEGDC
ncbi:hypothetical protein BS50DRAFT_640940 [Corynespora cassiicola Philippines]|uniref:Uncharacterized protein n=1 Tax=Corynespora cassiicola Philippines TaxID=1448308 RepID=A0A2T2N1S7_CORCC|nr:hypothetical protein BS50DRAFT_640940 [Corynespora cassiicola Philippines]